MATQTQEAVKETVSVKDASRIALVHPMYIRRLVRDGVLEGHKDRDGRWAIDKGSIIRYANAKKARETERIRKIQQGESTTPTRPTTASCERFRKRAVADKRLSAAEKQAVLQFIDRCQAHWDRAYKARSNGNTSDKE